MSVTMTTTSLGTSNLRGTSRQTRINPTRTSRNARPNLRQDSLISNPASAQGAPAPEPHGFYPAITHFTDAISALPRDFRRHTSLLKEVDAKAWALEENLQTLLDQCLVERQTRPSYSTTHTIAGSSSSVTGDPIATSTANSVNGALLDNVSQYSAHASDLDLPKRQQLYALLRGNLIQMMGTMDEKNHVINNANDDLSRHIRRLDDIWPHISDEISEEARLGSLKHWAYTDLNPIKKAVAATTSRGRDAAASLAILHENDIADRSERRREAMLANKKRMNQHLDSDAEDRSINRKATGNSKNKRIGELTAEPAAVTTSASAKGKTKKPEKPATGGAAMERSNSGPGLGGRAMSREPSQQENAKKRKAPVAVTTVARKRLNASTQESPKLASSPLAGGQGKEAYKRSPALSSVRPVAGRVRQNSSQLLEGGRARPTSSASHRNTNGNGIAGSIAELNNVAAMTGKTINEVKHTMKETVNNKGDRLVEEDGPVTSEAGMRGGIMLERSVSKQSNLKRETNLSDEKMGRSTASPRLPPIHTGGDRDKLTRGRVSKTATPVVSTFAEGDGADSGDAETAGENGLDGSSSSKPKRPARPRIKDHGLHDSLSPKGLPTKRTHKKNGSYSLGSNMTLPPSRGRDRDPDSTTSSRANSHTASTKDRERDSKDNIASTTTSQTATQHTFDTDMVDEPESLIIEPIPMPTKRSARHTQASNTAASSNSDHDPAPTSAPAATAPIPPTNHNTTTTTTRTSSQRNHSHTHERTRPTDTHPLSKPTTSTTNPTPSISKAPEADTDMDAEEDEADADADADPEADEEERYCYCHGVSYGEMVACDNKNCPREWFHLECIGLKSVPKSAKWYCDECKEGLKAR